MTTPSYTRADCASLLRDVREAEESLEAIAEHAGACDLLEVGAELAAAIDHLHRASNRVYELRDAAPAGE